MAWNEAILGRKKPNFFELVAEEQLRESLRPALVYLIKVLARARPHLFSSLWRSRDELHLALDLVVQSCFLRLHDGLFTESFYCLKRVTASSSGGHQASGNLLSLKIAALSLTYSVLVPYLNVKLERLYSRLIDENDTGGLSWQSRGQSTRQSVKYLIFMLTPYLQSTWIFINFVFRLRYLMLSSAYYSPLHWVAGVILVQGSQNSEAGFTKGVWSWVSGQLLSLCLFSLRLLQWWYSGENEYLVRKMTVPPVPPPPPPRRPYKVSNKSTEGEEEEECLLTDVNSCPLCKQPRNEPTVLASSGFVFCYNCISDYVQLNGRCPVTHLPSSVKQLIRLFFTSNH